MEAIGVWWPSWSSKPVARSERVVGSIPIRLRHKRKVGGRNSPEPPSSFCQFGAALPASAGNLKKREGSLGEFIPPAFHRRNHRDRRFGRLRGWVNRKLTSGRFADSSPAAMMETRSVALPASVARPARVDSIGERPRASETA